MRAIIKLSVAAIPVLFVSGVSQAAPLYEGPWCGVYSGRSAGAPNCTFRTFEECRMEMVAGNRGHCNINPTYSGPPPRARKRVVRHY